MKYITLLLILISISVYSQKTFESVIDLPNIEFGGNVLETIDGYIVTGYSKSRNNSDFDIVLIKLDINGDTDWIKYLGETGKDERPSYLCSANDGGYLICGTQDFSKTIIYKTNVTGDSIWRNVLHKNTYDEYGKSVLQLNDTTIFCIGANGIESTIYQLDNNGFEKNHKSLDSISITEISKYNSESFALVGTKTIGEYNTDIYYSIVGDSIKILTEKHFGGEGEDIGFSITSDKNGDLYILGHYDYMIPDYGKGILILKVDDAGDTIWHNSLDWIFDPTHICIDSNLNSYFSYSVEYYDGELGTLTDIGFGIVKIDSVGDYSWDSQFNGLTELGNNFTPTTDNGLIISGYNNQDLRILKLNQHAQLPTGIDKTFSDFEEISIYPNPTEKIVNITTNGQIQRISIYDFQGKLISEYDKYLNQINLSNLTSGIYLLNITFINGQTKGYQIIKE